MNTPTSTVLEQVRLPARVALQVVLQGMRIRFGRSLVTIMGVVLGIAFLMSILTSQLLKAGVAAEQEVRLEIQRMSNFLKAEMGSPVGKSFGILAVGEPDALEWRFVKSLASAGAGGFRWASPEGLRPAEAGLALDDTSLGSLAAGSDMILLVGGGALSGAAGKELAAAGEGLRVAATRELGGRELPGGLRIISLSRQLTEEEQARIAADARTARYRNAWIIVISLLVTVIGISNALLMSVTERFREIGTMKCLGALSAFIRQIFLFESCLIGAAGGLLGSLAGAVFSMLLYAFTFGFGLVGASLAGELGSLLLYSLFSFAAGVVLSILAAIYPAQVASRMVPANALRSNV